MIEHQALEESRRIRLPWRADLDSGWHWKLLANSSAIKKAVPFIAS